MAGVIILALIPVVVTVILANDVRHNGVHISEKQELQQHVKTARQERKDNMALSRSERVNITQKVEELQECVQEMEVEQARIIQTLDLVYEEIIKD